MEFVPATFGSIIPIMRVCVCVYGVGVCGPGCILVLRMEEKQQQSTTFDCTVACRRIKHRIRSNAARQIHDALFLHIVRLPVHEYVKNRGGYLEQIEETLREMTVDELRDVACGDASAIEQILQLRLDEEIGIDTSALPAAAGNMELVTELGVIMTKWAEGFTKLAISIQFAQASPHTKVGRLSLASRMDQGFTTLQWMHWDVIEPEKRLE